MLQPPSMMWVVPVVYDDWGESVRTCATRACLVGCQVQHQRRDLIGRPQAAHALPRHKVPPRQLRIALPLSARPAGGMHARSPQCAAAATASRPCPGRWHCSCARQPAGAHAGRKPHALVRKVDCNGFGQPNHRRLGGAVHAAVRRACNAQAARGPNPSLRTLDAGGDAGHVDDGAVVLLNHLRR